MAQEESKIVEMEQATEAAQAAAENKANSLTYVHKFRKPVEIEGKEYKSMNFYFDKLTGADIEAIEDEMAAKNEYVPAPEFSSKFQSMLAARAAGIGSDEIRRLPAGDYMQIKNKARDFLLGVGL